MTLFRALVQTLVRVGLFGTLFVASVGHAKPLSQGAAGCWTLKHSERIGRAPTGDRSSPISPEQPITKQFLLGPGTPQETAYLAAIGLKTRVPMRQVAPRWAEGKHGGNTVWFEYPKKVAIRSTKGGEGWSLDLKFSDQDLLKGTATHTTLTKDGYSNAEFSVLFARTTCSPQLKRELVKQRTQPAPVPSAESQGGLGGSSNRE